MGISFLIITLFNYYNFVLIIMIKQIQEIHTHLVFIHILKIIKNGFTCYEYTYRLIKLDEAIQKVLDVVARIKNIFFI